MNQDPQLELPPKLEPYRAKIVATLQPYIRIKLTNNDRPTPWQSKFGGLPYLPQGADYPTNSKGNYLYLLAQINFAEVPNLKDFPNQGILQFFIAADEEFYEADFDRPTQQNDFRVVYFTDIISDAENLVIDFSFLPKLDDDCLMPFVGCCALDFTLAQSPITISDYQFKLFDSESETKPNYELWDLYQESLSLSGHKIGGYPNFTQQDPRTYQPLKNQDYILLLQVDSEGNEQIDIMWGDVGIGNFFIPRSMLQELDFSQVLYNWDCG